MDVFPTPLSRRNLFRAGLAAAAVSVTAGCAFQKPEEAASSAASPDAQAVLKLATGFAIQNLVPLKTGFWATSSATPSCCCVPNPTAIPPIGC